MLSFSTHGSAKHPMVEKVARAIELAKQQKTSRWASYWSGFQGLNKSVNDLSRGATTVDDIVNTVVITALQANS